MRRWAAAWLIGMLILAGCQSQPVTAPPKSEPVTVPPQSDPGMGKPVVQPAPLPAAFALVEIDMVDEQTGWGIPIGHFHLARTTDGGDTWHDVTPPGAEGEFDADLAALSADQAWLVLTYRSLSTNQEFPPVVAYRTSDGGQSWTKGEFVTPFRSLYGSSISFQNDLEGFVLVEPEHGMGSRPGVLYRTTDGGESWRLVAGADRMPFAGKVRFADANTGWVVGHQVSTTPEMLACTADGGLTWTLSDELKLSGDFPPGKVSVEKPPVPVGEHLLLEATFWPESGRVDAFRTLLYRSAGPGEPWELLSYLQGTPVFMPTGHGWAWAGEPRTPGNKAPTTGAFRVTTDGGKTWAGLAPDATLQQVLDQGYNVGQLDFVSARVGWAIVRAPGPHPPLLARTTDGGSTWVIAAVRQAEGRPL